MTHLPPIFIPPCEELTVVVHRLHEDMTAGTLTALPRNWRADLATLRRLCAEKPPEVMAMLEQIEALPDEEQA